MPECSTSLTLHGQPASLVRLNSSDLAVCTRLYQAGRDAIFKKERTGLSRRC